MSKPETVPSCTVSVMRPPSVARRTDGLCPLAVSRTLASARPDSRSIGASPSGPVMTASLSPACTASDGGLAAASKATLPDTVPEPSFATKSSSRSLSSATVTLTDASRSAGPAPGGQLADAKPHIAPPAMQNTERQRHVRTAVRHRQRHRICIDMTRHARFGAAQIDGKIAACVQRCRGQVELVRDQPASSTGEVRDQRQRTIAQPAGQAAQTLLLRQAKRRQQSTRAQDGAMRAIELHSPDFRLMVGLASNCASARASRMSMASASCGPADLHIQSRRPLPECRRRPPGNGQQVRQPGRIRCLDAELAVAQLAAIAQHARSPEVRAAHRTLEPAQQDVAGLDRRIHGQPIDRRSGQRRLADVEPQFGVEAGHRTGQIGRIWAGAAAATDPAPGDPATDRP